MHPPSTFDFPRRNFGKKKVVQQFCRAEWFSTWPWLHYHASDDVVLCHVCITGNSESSLVFAGFKNWKDGTVAFKDHQVSAVHKTALQLVVDIPSSCADVGEMLSSEYTQEKRINRQCLLKILSNVAFLAQQGLAFRGDGDEINSYNYCNYMGWMILESVNGFQRKQISTLHTIFQMNYLNQWR